MDFKNRKWNYLNRKRNYFSPFQSSVKKNFFNKSISNWSKDSKMYFRNRKWYYLKRKWNYFSPFQSSEQKTSLTKWSPIGIRIRARSDHAQNLHVVLKLAAFHFLFRWLLSQNAPSMSFLVSQRRRRRKKKEERRWGWN